MKQIQCPNCESYKTVTFRSGYLFLGFFCLFFIITIPFSIVFWILAFTPKKYKYTCLSCKYKFNDPKEKRINPNIR